MLLRGQYGLSNQRVTLALGWHTNLRFYAECGSVARINDEFYKDLCPFLGKKRFPQRATAVTTPTCGKRGLEFRGAGQPEAALQHACGPHRNRIGYYPAADRHTVPNKPSVVAAEPYGTSALGQSMQWLI